MGDGESEQLMMWPALNVIGLLVLLVLVITLGTVSTDRYEREREQRARGRLCPVPSAFDSGR
jgi:hypothetical protein